MIEVDEMTLAYLQINNSTLACDFSDFHKAVEKVLGREVYTHQFGSKRVLEEKRMYFKHREAKEQNLCYEDIRDLINQKFKESCDKQQSKRPITNNMDGNPHE